MASSSSSKEKTSSGDNGKDPQTEAKRPTAEMNYRMTALLQKSANQVCADCPARRPLWTSFVSTNTNGGPKVMGVFICTSCAQHHYFVLGEKRCHIQHLKNAHEFSLQDIMVLERTGNAVINRVLEAELTSEAFDKKFVSKEEEEEEERRSKFIKHKYKKHKYIDAIPFHELVLSLLKPLENDPKYYPPSARRKYKEDAPRTSSKGPDFESSMSSLQSKGSRRGSKKNGGRLSFHKSDSSFSYCHPDDDESPGYPEIGMKQPSKSNRMKNERARLRGSRNEEISPKRPSNSLRSSLLDSCSSLKISLEGEEDLELLVQEMKEKELRKQVPLSSSSKKGVLPEKRPSSGSLHRQNSCPSLFDGDESKEYETKLKPKDVMPRNRSSNILRMEVKKHDDSQTLSYISNHSSSSWLTEDDDSKSSLSAASLLAKTTKPIVRRLMPSRVASNPNLMTRTGTRNKNGMDAEKPLRSSLSRNKLVEVGDSRSRYSPKPTAATTRRVGSSRDLEPSAGRRISGHVNRSSPSLTLAGLTKSTSSTPSKQNANWGIPSKPKNKLQGMANEFLKATIVSSLQQKQQPTQSPDAAVVFVGMPKKPPSGVVNLNNSDHSLDYDEFLKR